MYDSGLLFLCAITARIVSKSEKILNFPSFIDVEFSKWYEIVAKR